ncbi:MAG: hypothetical protein FJ030_04345 [Chloroflexi bacterium]|nr:hypothetical protein [Chloroflexota bacterium]
MIARYHAIILAESVGQHFSPEALNEVVAANIGQDSPLNLLNSVIHFDNSLIREAPAYIEEQHALLARADDPRAMRAAFGRLTHTAQDFYAHSNYVDLWLAARGGIERARPEGIDGLDPAILDSPNLKTAHFYLWRDFIFYVPLFQRFARKHLVFPNSHEEMHLDDPSRGPKFYYAIAAAKQRTLAEYRRAIQSLGAERAADFHRKHRE